MVDAAVAARTPDGRGLQLRVIRTSGPGAPEPGSSIRQTATAVTARGCYRAEWTDEVRRARAVSTSRTRSGRFAFGNALLDRPAAMHSPGPKIAVGFALSGCGMEYGKRIQA